MALSQVQCLDDNHINVRTSESKPDFFYSEEQRLALETLIQEGRDAFEDYVKTNNVRCFLSDLELQRILNTVEVYSPGSPDVNAELHDESDGEQVSLQYWPELSDYSIPQLDIGWPDWMSYRGVTRVNVYTQPPYDGQAHIKEVVRKMIGQAQKVVAIVMDLFTDIDIFKDVLDACYRRKVAAYVILESTGVKHFVRMCDKAGMHTGHLKNLRVRRIRGMEFFNRSSKRVCGHQSQKFMFIDGDKAVSGSYSFTWSASRLDRNIITVLTGQAVEIFDKLFQDMYVMSNAVCLSKINLGSEPEPEILSQAVPTVFPTANTAHKLINPKYSLVSNYTFNTNGPASDQTNAKNSITKNQKEAVKKIRDKPALPPIHPGLLNLEKANMIQYVPTWPDPEPSSDVIGFINIRDTNRPLQAHLMRSELFEVSQAIRFKESVSEAKESLSVSAHPISQTPSVPEALAQTQTRTEDQSASAEAEKQGKYFDQNQQQESSQCEELISQQQSPEPETLYVLTVNKEDKEATDVMKKEQDSLHSKSICTDSFNSISSCDKDNTVCSDAVHIMDAPQPFQCPTQTPNNLDVKSPSDELNKPYRDSRNISVEQNLIDKVIIDVVTPLLEVNESNQNRYDTQTSKCDSNLSSLSDYYDCISPMSDSRFDSEVFVMEKTSDLQSTDNQIKHIQQEQEFTRLNTDISEDSTVCSNNNQTLFTPRILKMSCSVVFNFPQTESNTIVTPFITTPVRDGLSDKSTLPDKAQTPNSGFNFSSISEEYFECSETVGFDGMSNVMEPRSQPEVSDFDASELHDTVKDTMPAVTLQKLIEMTIQEDDKHNNMKEIDEHNIQSGLEKSSVIEMTTNGHLESYDTELSLSTEDDAQMDETVHRQQIQDPKVTQGLVVESEVLYDCFPEHKAEMILEVQKEELKTEKAPLQSEINLDLMCETQSVQIAKETEKPPNLDLNLGLICKEPSVQLEEKTVTPTKLKSQSATDSESVVGSAEQDKSTPVIPEKKAVTKSTDLYESKELQRSLSDLDSGSNHSSNHEFTDSVNEFSQKDGEVCQTELKSNVKENHLELPEHFETDDLLILEDSDLQEMEERKQKRSPSRRTKAAVSSKVSKTENAGLKTVNVRKPLESKLDLYSKYRKEICHLTAPVKKKEEGESVSTIQVKKNLPEAKPKLDCQVRKQPHQESDRIPVAKEAWGDLSTLSITIPHSRSQRPQASKAETHRCQAGQPLGQNNPLPCPEKLPTEKTATPESNQTQQRLSCNVHSPDHPTSCPKQPHVQLNGPKSRPSDQHVSRKHSASTSSYSSSGISFPRQMKTFKETPVSKKKKE